MVTAIILAAGLSRRFGKNKLLMPLLGKPLLYYSIQAIHDHPETSEVYIVAQPKAKTLLQKMVKDFHFPKVKGVISGGSERQYSFMKSFSALKNRKPGDIILVHNGANPLVSDGEISAVIKAARQHGAAAVGRPVIDTIKEIENGHFTKTHPREKLMAMQTPQAAHYKHFQIALGKAKTHRQLFTDETSLLEFAGIKVKHVTASPQNFKITTIKDYDYLKTIMGDTPEGFLVGLGQDSHSFEKTKKGLWLGGFCLKNEQKLKADSDGDVLIHALCNAISQAIGEKSLGSFATSMFKEKNIKDSKKYLAVIIKKMKAKKYHLHNIGLMIEGKKPKIDPLVPQIKKSLTNLTGVSLERIGITATTGDNLTAFGKGEGLQCFAIVSLRADHKES